MLASRNGGAMSSILPAVDALLGISNTSVELREAVKTFEVLRQGGTSPGEKSGENHGKI